MKKSTKKATKRSQSLRKAKKLEAQKPLDIPIVRTTDVPSVKLYQN